MLLLWIENDLFKREGKAITKKLPKELESSLPTIEEIEKGLEISQTAT